MADSNKPFFRFLAYALEILVLFILNATPGLLPEIFGAKPALLVCVAVTVAVFEREVSAMVTGLFCGALIDLGYAGSVGVFAISLTILCFLLGFLSNNVIMATFLNFLISSAIVCTVVFLLYFLFSYVWAGYDAPGTYFLNHILSRMVQTFVFSIPFYFVNKFVYETLSDEA